MASSPEHIAVCICTYRRPESLRRLLSKLCDQHRGQAFTFSVSIVDNDPLRSAQGIVECFLHESGLQIAYDHIPDKNLALLRNATITMSRGDHVAFIDDDEYPSDDWLLLLQDALTKHNAAGVCGPVIPEYLASPPDWVVKGRFCERTRLPSGSVLKSDQTRTGNALIRREIFADPRNLFDTRFRMGGEDVSLFRKLISRGYRFVWCDEASVYEEVPPSRLTVSYFTRRSILIGNIAYENYWKERSKIQNILVFCKSLAACVALLFMLPIYRAGGYYRFVRARTRLSYHWAIALTFLRLLHIESRDL